MRLFFLSLLVGSTCSLAASLHTQDESTKLSISLDKFLSIACDKAGKQCIAVGYGKEPHGDERLVYTSNDSGHTWGSPVTLVSPKTSAPISNGIYHKAKINCDASAQRCVVVSTVLVNNLPTPIVYNTQDGGLTWSEPVLLGLPKNVDKKQVYQYPQGIYVDIGCDYAGYNCLIAGGLIKDNKGAPFMYVSHDAGYTWTSIYSFKEKSNFGSLLMGVHCDNSGFHCLATGYSMTKNSYFSRYYSSKPVVYVTEDGGQHWKDPIILPTEITDNNASTLTDVHCSGSGKQCTVLGFTYDYLTALRDFFTFTSNDGGLKWSKRVNISPAADIYLSSLGCDDTEKNCTAVGWYTTLMGAHRVYKPLIYATKDGATTWERNTTFAFPSFSELSDIFCSARAENCIAVGVKTEMSLSLKSALRQPSLDAIKLPTPQIQDSK